MATAIFWEDADYMVRPAIDTDETKAQWWRFMQILGWNRSYHDFETWLQPSRGCGMIVLVEKATNKLIGQIAAIIHSNSTGWVSMFIIDEPYRGKGLGRHLFKACETDMQRLNVQIIGLDGVPEQRGTYERRGFEAVGSVRLMVRDLHEKTPVEAEMVQGITDIRSVPRDLLVASDLKYSGFLRQELWNDENLFNRSDVSGVALLRKPNPQDEGDILAWAVLRRCSRGVRISPLYAQDVKSAKAVLAATIRLATVKWIKQITLPNEDMHEWSDGRVQEEATIEAEVWTGNPHAVAAFEELGWQDSGHQYFRMWYKGESTTAQRKNGIADNSMFVIWEAAMG